MRVACYLAVALLFVCCSETRLTVEPLQPLAAGKTGSVPPAVAKDAGDVQPDASDDEAPATAEVDASQSMPSGDSRTDAGMRANDPKPPEPMDQPAQNPPEQKPGVRMDPQPEVPEDTPVEPDPSECDFIEIRARADSSGAPFRVSGDIVEEYQCFVFDEAFTQPTQALAIYPAFDNKSVVHHWMLYTTEEIDTSKITTRCGAFQENSALLAGGGPGGPPWFMPKHVGLDIGSGKFILEVHYANVLQKDTTDRSGARICTTKNLRPETAVVHWLGNQLFSIPPRATNFPIAGRCKPAQVQRPIHLLRSWPHMHKLGNRMTLEIDRANGSKSMVFDARFSFDAQQNVDANVVLEQGDSLLTTCFYDNPNDYPVNVGSNTTDEMCNNFVVAYPAGALVSDFLNLVKNSCLGLP
jgi:hypothetical protein